MIIIIVMFVYFLHALAGENDKKWCTMYSMTIKNVSIYAYLMKRLNKNKRFLTKDNNPQREKNALY